jgi:hypothetical protein
VSSFTEARFEEVVGKRREGRKVYRAAASFRFWIGHPDAGMCIMIPQGFETDGASIPVPILRLLPGSLRDWVMGQLAKSAAVHDLMREDLQFSLMDADALFLVAMEADGVNWALKWVAFAAVRTNKSRDPHSASPGGV